MSATFLDDTFPTAVAHTATAVYFERAGQVLRAPRGSVIMPDGFPCGRWECSREHWNRYAQSVYAGFVTFASRP